MSNKKNPEDLVGKYIIDAFPKNRQIASEFFDEFLKKHYMAGLFEVNMHPGKQGYALRELLL